MNKSRFANELNNASIQAGKNSFKHGFYTPVSIGEAPTRLEHVTQGELMLGKLALVHSEVSEAAEAVRENDSEKFIEELADIVIRVMDIAGNGGWDLGNVVVRKMEKNATREQRHGKVTRI